MAMGRVVVSMTMEVCTYKTVLSCFSSHSARQKKRAGMCNRVINAKNKSKKNSILLELPDYVI